MTGKKYQIELDGKLIGTTMLEKADAPMGVAFGQIEFTKDCNEYQFLKTTFKEKGISYPFYEEEFPHHVREYEEMFKKEK